MIDILVVYPCNHNVLHNIDLVTNYDDMKAHFIYQSLSNIKHINIQAVCIPELFTYKDFKDPNLEFIFKKVCADAGIHLGIVNHVLFAKLKFKAIEYSMRSILEIVHGKLWKLEDKNIKLSNNLRIQTLGHYTESGSTKNYYELGQVVANHLFTSKQKEEQTLRVHVDHNLLDRKHCIKEIQEILYTIKNNIKTHQHWNKLKVTYHTQETEIADIGHFDYEFIPIENLAEIYSRTHLAFASHNETLGMYHLEMLASGASVFVLNSRMIKEPLLRGLPILKNFNLNMIDRDFIYNRISHNTHSVENISFNNYANKLIRIILNR